LQRLLDARFSRENLAAIEEACTRFFENAPILDPSSVRSDAGIYLLRELASDMLGLCSPEKPMAGDRYDALVAGPWREYRQFANVVFHDPDSDRLLAAFQKALSALLAFP